MITLIVLLFTAGIVMQMEEDYYFAQLSSRHLDERYRAEISLREAFNSLRHTEQKNPECFVKACQLDWNGIKIDYAFHRYAHEHHSLAYLEYSLRSKTAFADMWLRVVVEETAAEKIVSWLFYNGV
ncbi:MAG: hypothetical protein LRY67_03620 [Gammaproteobacteria bacterium]|nr:hypothetical protein [Gammaproteobacteria bacterium]MCD8542753.1 hypothetical protein [Gammaproteobacteria bacterium]